MFFGGPPNNIQNIPRKRPTKNCEKRPPNFRDHLLRHPSAAFDAAPSHQNMSEVLFKTSPKNDHPRIAQNGFSGFSTMFYILPLRNQIHSIMVTLMCRPPMRYKA